MMGWNSTHRPRRTLPNNGIFSRLFRPASLWLGLAATVWLPGCQYANHTDAGAGLGAGLGALTGAMVGRGSGHPLGGALIGAVAGGAVGGLVGNSVDRQDQRDAAIAQAQYLEATGQCLTNDDVIRMVHAGLSDEVIIGTIRNSFGKYDLSPHATIQLKSYGASDQVILALQKVPKTPPLLPVDYSRSRRYAHGSFAHY